MVASVGLPVHQVIQKGSIRDTELILALIVLIEDSWAPETGPRKRLSTVESTYLSLGAVIVESLIGLSKGLRYVPSALTVLPYTGSFLDPVTICTHSRLTCVPGVEVASGASYMRLVCERRPTATGADSLNVPGGFSHQSSSYHSLSRCLPIRI